MMIFVYAFIFTLAPIVGVVFTNFFFRNIKTNNLGLWLCLGALVFHFASIPLLVGVWYVS